MRLQKVARGIERNQSIFNILKALLFLFMYSFTMKISYSLLLAKLFTPIFFLKKKRNKNNKRFQRNRSIKKAPTNKVNSLSTPSPYIHQYPPLHEHHLTSLARAILSSGRADRLAPCASPPRRLSLYLSPPPTVPPGNWASRSEQRARGELHTALTHTYTWVTSFLARASAFFFSLGRTVFAFSGGEREKKKASKVGVLKCKRRGWRGGSCLERKY